jgi:hypothetical protein
MENSMDEMRRIEEATADSVDYYHQAMLRTKNYKEWLCIKGELTNILFVSASRSMTK